MKTGHVIVIAVMALLLTACTGGEPVTMDTIDNHLNRDDVQYVELREAFEIAELGMIEGFDMIPFYTEFVNPGHLTFPPDGQFHVSHIHDEAAIRAYFDADKTIYLVCRRGNRTRFMHDVLVHLGYDVVDVGGIEDYHGDNLIYP